MKKLILLFMALPLCTLADDVATTAALSTLQNQLSSLQQQVQTDEQGISAINQNLSDVGNQLTALQTQVNQYGSSRISQFKWVDVDNSQLPSNAYVAASNGGNPVYICQAPYSNGSGYYSPSNNIVDPGVVSANGCVITYNGQAYLVPQYSILTSNVPGYWISGEYIKSNNIGSPIMPLYLVRVKGTLGPSNQPPTSNEPTPLYNALAIIGGQENNTNVYICRVQINQQYFVGKSMNNTCYVAAGQYEGSWPNYEVLLTRKP